jgi:hypothetical protein
LKWDLLFDERRDLTATGHSPSTGGDSSGHSLTNWLYSVSCNLTTKLLVALASTMILGSESHGTHGHILLSDGSGSLQDGLLLPSTWLSTIKIMRYHVNVLTDKDLLNKKKEKEKRNGKS